MDQRFSRRSFLLSVLASGVALPAMANPPESSLFPQGRPIGFGKRGQPSPQDLIANAKLDGAVGYVVRDGASGLVLEEHNAHVTLPPASVAKALTAAYALKTLGPDYRFSTKVFATGEITDGIVQGNVILAGGGDPTLDTDDLDTLCTQMAQAGIIGATGDFLVWGGALPFSPKIDDAQPDQVGYSPGVSGLNLNFNRVHFEWKRSGSGYAVTMQGRSGRFQPNVTMARMSVKDRAGPVYTYTDAGDIDSWTVARSALGSAGSRWLPVRKPALYAGQVFRSLAKAHGITLPAPQQTDTQPAGTLIADYQSADLTDILRGMLKYSTNLTAEVIGLAATKARLNRALPTAQSAAAMCDWLAEDFSLEDCALTDHSGLGGDSRISASDMSSALYQIKHDPVFKTILKEVKFLDAKRRIIQNHPLQVHAKTGTLNFVSGLAGYVDLPDGRELDFAIFTGDLDRRSRIPKAERERPSGAATWNRRAKTLQQALIERWGALYPS